MAAGQVPTPLSMLSAAQVSSASDSQLAQTAAAILAEQHRRAVEGNDLDAVVEEAFVDGFDHSGHPKEPWMAGGLLICPGYIRYKSATSHLCAYVSVEGHWVWESARIVTDVVRQVPGPKTFKQAISIVSPEEGMRLDLVHSESKQGAACQMKKATSYQIRNGELVAVSTRTRAPQGHRKD